ncbi:MAG: efflux RND transporter periplasmic adaptor subunit [Acidobacteria bacterium]|nr:efflux RND transporter periplasmic adaptor subunit [Acidobacteriota bacterium]
MPLALHNGITTLLPLCLLATQAVGWSQTLDLAPVVSRPVSRTIELPGEVLPFLSVSIHAKVRGYLERISVDRGSLVKQGQLLAELSAPEVKAEIAEAESKVHAAESERLQAEAQLAAAASTATRLATAARTPGAIAGNELIQAQKQVEAATALVESKRQAIRAAQSVVAARRELEAYLRITAPFDGVVTDRLVHPGALVGPGPDPVLLVLQQVSRLRLVVAVPEENIGGIVRGARVEFRVPAYPGRSYAGAVARLSNMLDPKTRTMAVELDVVNRDGSLFPGMYPAVKWPVRRARPSLFVPKTSVVTTRGRGRLSRGNRQPPTRRPGRAPSLGRNSRRRPAPCPSPPASPVISSRRPPYPAHLHQHHPLAGHPTPPPSPTSSSRRPPVSVIESAT